MTSDDESFVLATFVALAKRAVNAAERARVDMGPEATQAAIEYRALELLVSEETERMQRQLRG